MYKYKYKQAQYKKHLRRECSNNAVCGSPTLAPKLLIKQWREIPPLWRCSTCELVLNMGRDPASIDVAKPPMHTETKVMTQTA